MTTMTTPITSPAAYAAAYHQTRYQRVCDLVGIAADMYNTFCGKLPNAAENLMTSLRLTREDFKNAIALKAKEHLRCDEDTITQVMVFFFAYITGVPVLYDGGKDERIDNPLVKDDTFKAFFTKDAVVIELGVAKAPGLYVPPGMTLPTGFGEELPKSDL